MTNRNLYRSLGGLDPELIAKAAPDLKVQSGKKHLWLKLAAVAVCLAVIVGAVIVVPLFREDVPNKRYELKKIGNKYCLMLSESVLESIENIEMNQLGTIDFDSVEEFVNTVKNGKLNDSQLAIANRVFEKDSNGNIIVCDFSKIQVPVHPKEFEVQKVYWSGELYSFLLEAPNDMTAYFHYLDKEAYDYTYEIDYLNFFDRELVTTTKVVNGKDKTEYYYSTSAGELKSVRYTVTKGDTVLIVDETYRLNMNDNSLQVSGEIPSHVTIYGCDSGIYFSIDVFGLKEKPTLKWINDFGIKAYK